MMNRILKLLTISAASLTLAAPAASGYPGDCRNDRCVQHRHEVRMKWEKAVHAYGRGILDARAECEGGSNYKARFYGGFWFTFQFEFRSWVGAGGFVRNGEPVGRWRYQPKPLEMRYRAVRWDGIHGGDAWPHCP